MMGNLFRKLQVGARFARYSGMAGRESLIGSVGMGLANATAFRNEGDSFGGSFLSGAGLGAGLGAGIGWGRKHLAVKARRAAAAGAPKLLSAAPKLLSNSPVNPVNSTLK